MSAGRRRLALGAALLAAGCSFGPAPRPVASEYDFGPPAAAAPARALREPILVHDVGAPPWLGTNAMLYRLAYRDAAQPRAYANSRWAAPPAALLTESLRRRLAEADPAGVLVPGDGARAPVELRVELLEFSQVFTTPDKSAARIDLRATLLRDRRLAAQRSFTVEVPAATPDAAGGAAAFATAQARASGAILAWIAEHAGR